MSAARIRELPLGEILTQELVLDGMTSRTKKAAIEELVGLLYKEGRIKKKSEAITRVLEREDLVTTALSEGIAIPHARLEVGEKPVIAIGRHQEGIDFGAPDGKPVHLIVLVLWAPEQPGLFNRLFAGLVTKLAKPEFRDLLMNAKSAKEIADNLSDVRVDLMAGRATRCEADMLISLQLNETKKRAGAKGLERQIELARAELPGSMLSRFDRLLELHGEALVAAPKGVCEGCNMALSSRFASEMLANPDMIYVCERCGRYLIYNIG